MEERLDIGAFLRHTSRCAAGQLEGVAVCRRLECAVGVSLSFLVTAKGRAANVEGILDVMAQSPRHQGYRCCNRPDLKAHALVARRAAADGMVLLKNDGGVLPLAGDRKHMAVFGNASYEIITGGTGSGKVNEAYSVTLVEGLRNGGFALNPSLQDLYTDHIKQARASQASRGGQEAAFMMGRPPIDEMQVSADLAARLAEEADMALITSPD